MKRLAKLFGALLTLSCCAIGTGGQEPTVDGVVIVRVVGEAAASEDVEESLVAAVAAAQGLVEFLTGGLGFVADTSTVVASLAVADTSAEYEVITTSEVAHTARLRAYDETHRVGLLSVPGLELQPYPFARDPADSLQVVVGVLRSPDAYELVDGRISQVAGNVAGTIASMRHDAVRPRRYNLGTPLLNICGEAVGIVVSETGDPVDFSSGTAMSVSWLRDRFQEHGLVVGVADTRCLSAEERLAAVAAAADAATKRADSAAAAATSAAQRAAAADSAAAAAAQAQRRAEREAQSEIEEIRREATTDRARYARWAATVGGGLVLIALTVWFGIARSARRAQRGQATAETAARAAQIDLATRQARDRVAASVPSVFLDGTDGDGLAVGVRVPGRVIAEDAGAVVGRSPFDCAVVIDHKEVSRRHFRLCRQGDGVSIVDLDSTNGTVLNGADLPPNVPVPLPDSSVLNLGGLKLTVRLQS